MNHSTAAAPSDVQALVGALVQRARAAQRIAEGYDQARVDELVAAAGWAIIEPARNRALAELAVADTGIGNVADKIAKNHRKTLGLLRDLNGAKSVGVIAEHAAIGIVEIARPVGVVCAITPSTNPGATPGQQDHQCAEGPQRGDRRAVAERLGHRREADRVHPRPVRPHRRAARPGPAAAVTGRQAIDARADAPVRPRRRDRLAGQRARRLRERHTGLRSRRRQRRRRSSTRAPTSSARPT